MPPPKPDFIAWWSSLAPIVSWVLVILGWKVINKDNNTREKRHEMRSALDALIADISQLELSAHQYYTQSDTDIPALLGISIKTGYAALDNRLKILNRMSDGFKDAEKYLVEFGADLTGGNFEQKDRIKVPQSDRKLLEISLSKRNLVDCLEEAYNKCWYPK